MIPRLFKLPQAICQIIGKQLHQDGRVTVQDKKEKSVESLKNWYDSSHRCLPDGAILLQSSTAHSWPYPAYLYGKASWAAVDVLYFMSDIPITFMQETHGEVYRLEYGSVFQHEQRESKHIKRRNSQVMMALLEEGNEEDTEESKA